MIILKLCFRVNKKMVPIEHVLDGNPISTKRYDIEYNIDSKNMLLNIIPKTNLYFEKVELVLDYKYERTTKILVNGYQSWCRTFELPITKKQEQNFSLPKILSHHLGIKNYSDGYFFTKNTSQYRNRSYNFTYVRNDSNYQLFGSLNDNFCYTIFSHDYKEQKMHILLDIKGRELKNKKCILNVVIINGGFSVITEYANMLSSRSVSSDVLYGYTSWYNHYQNISEDILKKDLLGLDDDCNVFQIDDGYQSAVGDWMYIDIKKFPNGLPNFIESIHHANKKAGLWIAPFVCEKKSLLYFNHKEYLLHKAHNTPYYVGSNWSDYYALDIYNTRFINYLKECFDYFIDECKIDFFKLDFLFVANLKTYKNKTRSEVMDDAVNILKKLARGKPIIGCGVPLYNAFNNFEYCRVGCDVSLNYSGPWYLKFFKNLPSPCTKNSIVSSIYMSSFNKVGFSCDPDVFILRMPNQKLTFEQKKSLLILNLLSGGMCLCSDNMSLYDNKAKKLLNDNKHLIDAMIINIKEEGGLIEIKYEFNDKVYELIFNVKKGILVE